ncbi:hypothetical protein [Clostridium beijerinckii]|uniref:hypothetical protein n=1 Tax=Clostridium beijerinckii TaxID=1520 RepID=UPI00098C91C0|nr:hypothetical protein [Clostridium beijerinckii]MBA8932413.1 hypothetical protein [Clostridium beijerinckii]NRT37617.1 hypothetical protein [Clostridium beijerinckii]NRT48640.1 hypothetical protein [Clostridium beijerinckii]NRU36617.1 hypothetical protein [Clostridium beijerinckii]NRZ23064.1 hypothetical protein [Clostridium beijerinckii]
MKFSINNYNEKNINFIKERNLKYDFVNYIDEELINDRYSWIFCNEDEESVAAHRSLIMDNTVILRGLFISKKLHKSTLQISILKYVISYYSNMSFCSIITFVDDNTQEKEFLIKKFKLKLIKSNIFRASLFIENIPDYSNDTSIRHVFNVSSNDINKILSQSIYKVFNKENWIHFLNADNQYINLHYYVDHNILEIDDVITNSYDINILKYINIILHKICNLKIKYININFSKQLKISLLYIYMNKPRYVIPNVRIYSLEKN